MPAQLGGCALESNIQAAHSLANLQPHQQLFAKPSIQAVYQDPALASRAKISPADLAILKDKFPILCELSDDFLRDRTVDELLRIESTSLRIKEAERIRETEDRLSANKSAMENRFYDVAAGRDNRSTEIHPARFLPGMVCSAERQFVMARQVLGLSSPPALGCYDMTSVGMAGHVTGKGWLELGNMGSSKIKVSLYSVNNAAKSSAARTAEGDEPEMKDISEFIRALRTLMVAAQMVVPWNLSFVALENFLFDRDYCKEELKHDVSPAKTLCQFCDFVLAENSNKYRDGTRFLTYSELKSFWDSFISARPQTRASHSTSGSSSSPSNMARKDKQLKDQSRKRKYPYTGICNKFNTNTCQKIPGTCYTFRGEPLRHVCNWRDPAVPNAQPCGQAHMRIVAH